MGHIKFFGIKIEDFSMIARITVNIGFFDWSKNITENGKF